MAAIDGDQQEDGRDLQRVQVGGIELDAQQLELPISTAAAESSGAGLELEAPHQHHAHLQRDQGAHRSGEGQVRPEVLAHTIPC